MAIIMKQFFMKHLLFSTYELGSPHQIANTVSKK